MPDFLRPQPFNVEIGEHELADDFGSRFMPAPIVPYRIPDPHEVVQDADLYPERKHGLLPPVLRQVRKKT